MSDPLWDAIQALPPYDPNDTRETSPAELVELILMEGRDVTVTEPGEVIEDVDGIPSGIDPPTTTDATMGEVRLTAEQWESVARYLINNKE